VDVAHSADPLAHRFVMELLGTGLAMSNALSSLLEDFDGEEPWPGEDTGEVLLEMTVGSIRPALKRASVEEVERAIDLIVAVRERFVRDLRLAAELSGRRGRLRR
jgi:hypothetical protein